MSSTDELCELLDNLEMDYERDGDVIRFRHEGTDRLRAMLDKHGIPWKDYGHPHRTWWGAWYAEERSRVNAPFLKVEGVVSPEQAIAATLGRESDDATMAELREKVARQAHQLKEVQTALERRNRELRNYRDLVHDLQVSDGWPDDDKLRGYGIDPSKIRDGCRWCVAAAEAERVSQ